MTEWATPTSIRARLRRRWDSGAVLTERARGAAFVPIDVPIHGPTASELGARYAEVAAWARTWRNEAGPATMGMKVVGARRTGANDIPSRLRLETFEDLAAFLGVSTHAGRHSELLALAKDVAPEIHSWVADRPMRALANEAEFERLLACVCWVVQNADRNRYLRQIDVRGVDTKFIERHRAILIELVDLVTEPADRQARGFAPRYGFLDKPARVRVRVLDAATSPLPSAITDLELPADELAALPFDVERVFVVENDVTFLAFPPVARSLLIFGGGYAVSRICAARWLQDVSLYYWGDIDTHGFRILDLLRGHFPQARSMLMDRTTLLAHEAHWDREPTPVNTDLVRLTGEEAALYRDLLEDTFGPAVRLEQERVSFPMIEAAVRACDA